MITRLAATIAMVALVAGCAPYASEPKARLAADSKRDCFFLSQVDGYTHAGNNKIRVSVGPGRTYEFETLGSCPDLGNAEAIAFDPAGPGTICRGIDVDLIVPSTIGPRRCAVSMIRRIEE
ncbi:MAG: hypothetical protein KDE55_16220 [Novosphingobium sp.]|nr:hypothetical protein [Novosphingobium sp.]